jgi:hypothetical protein
MKLVLNDAHKLYLFLSVKENYLSMCEGMSKEYDDIFAYKILADKKNYDSINGLIKK